MEFKGGVVPVALLYDSSVEEVNRPLRETKESEERNPAKPSSKKGEHENKAENENKNIDHSKSEHQEVRGLNKNSKLLDIEARETDENSKYGLEIQSRNKVPTEEVQGLDKPFVYNIQPLSFYSSETKEEENILNYINKIKEMKENKLKIEGAKIPQEPQVTQKTEDAVVTETDSEEDNRPITRRIQHYETVIKPMMLDPQQYQQYQQFQQYQQYQQFQPYQQYPGTPQGYPVYPASTMGLYPQPNQQSLSPAFYQSPHSAQSVIYLPNPFTSHNSKKQNTKSSNTRIFDDYFPILINNPFNEIWAGITNIVEYGPAADVCKRSKKGREVDDDEDEAEIDFDERKIGFGSSGGGSGGSSGASSGSMKDASVWPRFAKLKVRKGGVAIAGPGGIATAGSGGTAIVGPGGTAYTTRQGTAVVGPGGRVVHVPQFALYAKDVDGSQPREFIPPPGSRTVAEGPIVYYDNPLDEEDIPDPAFPI